MNAPQGAQAPTFARLYQSATGHLPPAHHAQAAATGLPYPQTWHGRFGD